MLSPVASAAFLPSRSATRWLEDRRDALLGLKRLSIIFGIALGGRPAAALARRLMLPVSKDTLLRAVRRRAAGDGSPLHVIGIDDWAWKRGQRYGSIICDLERRRVVDLLPDREAATVEAWLSRHPEITVISRDRGGGYGQAATRAVPQAVQVADRWHLMENASAAFLEAVRRSMRPIRLALGSTIIDPTLLTHAERLQHEGCGGRKLMTSSARWPRPARRSKGDAITVARIERGVPALVTARDLVERFHGMVRERDSAGLPTWSTDAANSVLASFGKGIVADRSAVIAAMTQPWSNGQTEGQITKLSSSNAKCTAAPSSISCALASSHPHNAPIAPKESEPIFHAGSQFVVRRMDRRVRVAEHD